MTASSPHFNHLPAQKGGRRHIVQALREQISTLEHARRPRDGKSISSGCGPLDLLLPEEGFRWGTLVEWLSAEAGGGAATLAFASAREAGSEGGAVVVFDAAREFYPPAAVRLGIRLENLIVVQAATTADNLWALDQALRCSGVAAAVAWLEKLDGRTFRRLQLAAEEGGGLGLLIRPQEARSEPSWADVRLLVEPLPSTAGTNRRLRIEILRCRAATGGSVNVELLDPEGTSQPAGQPSTRQVRLLG
jgi:hypothetical protein